MEPNFHNIFDVHAHYYDEWFDEDRESLFELLPQKGVCNVINAAVDLETAETIKNYSEKVDYFYFAAGFHPENLENLPEDYLEKIKPYLSHKKCVALGEIGLDYYWDIPKDKQKRVLRNSLFWQKSWTFRLLSTTERLTATHWKCSENTSLKEFCTAFPEALK